MNRRKQSATIDIAALRRSVTQTRDHVYGFFLASEDGRGFCVFCGVRPVNSTGSKCTAPDRGAWLRKEGGK